MALYFSDDDQKLQSISTDFIEYIAQINLYRDGVQIPQQHDEQFIHYAARQIRQYIYNDLGTIDDIHNHNHNQHFEIEFVHFAIQLITQYFTIINNNQQ
jgi:hypothetical protein